MTPSIYVYMVSIVLSLIIVGRDCRSGRLKINDLETRLSVLISFVPILNTLVLSAIFYMIIADEAPK